MKEYFLVRVWVIGGNIFKMNIHKTEPWLFPSVQTPKLIKDAVILVFALPNVKFSGEIIITL